MYEKVDICYDLLKKEAYTKGLEPVNRKLKITLSKIIINN